MTFTMAAWFTLSFLIFGEKEEPAQIKSAPEDESVQTVKKEETDDEDIDNLSDTSRTFPTFSRQPPLRYSAPKIKKEEEPDEEEKILQATNIQPLTNAEADDEDEDADFVIEGRAGGRSDSGLGTSLESSAGRTDGVKRRRSRGFGSEGKEH